MSFGWFLLFGWIRIKCRHCSSRLVLISLGERFWAILAGGAVLMAAIFVFLDFSLHVLGERGVVVLFLGLIIATLLLSVYVAWQDSRFEVQEEQ